MKGIQETPTSGTQTSVMPPRAQASARNALTAGNNQKAIEEASAARFRSFSTEGRWREQLRLLRPVAKEVERVLPTRPQRSRLEMPRLRMTSTT
ncbi:hypothetical protein ACPA9J_10345 [Pseudomonas aeruginosa]